MSRYVSPLRKAQAAQTRARILEAASAEFGELGYAGTAMSGIARRAGVSLETVKQQGAKASLLLAAFEHAFAQVTDDRPLSEGDFAAEVAPLEGDRLLEFVTTFVTEANARVARLWPRLLEAAGDAEVGERLAKLQSNRRADMRSAIALYRQKGLCESSRSDEELAAELSFLLSPEGYTQLVVEAGWSKAAYRGWLERAVRRLILVD